MSAEESNTPDYSLLTKEEIEAMEADPSPEELVTMRQAQEAENLDDEDDGEIDSPKPEDKHQEESADESKPEDEPDQVPQKKPIYEARLGEDFQQKVAELKTQRTELREAYKNGDIDFDEYEDKLSTIDEQGRALDRAIVKAEISAEMQDQAATIDWQTTVSNFLIDTARNESIDYRSNDKLRDELDMYVKTLANNPANNDKSMEWFLKTAHNIVVNSNSLKTKPADQSGKQPTSRKTPTDAIPQTLAHTPGANDTADIESKFAELDKLDGLALETALARMSPEAREAYLQGA